MTEYICSIKIEKGENIKIPEGARNYRLKSGLVRFFDDIPFSSNGDILELPEGAVSITFNTFSRNRFHINYGEPTFHPSGGNILNTLRR
ncbi:MAG: hypothetical protein ABH804_02490 [archaeon]